MVSIFYIYLLELSCFWSSALKERFGKAYFLWSHLDREFGHCHAAQTNILRYINILKGSPEFLSVINVIFRSVDVVLSFFPTLYHRGCWPPRACSSSHNATPFRSVRLQHCVWRARLHCPLSSSRLIAACYKCTVRSDKSIPTVINIVLGTVVGFFVKLVSIVTVNMHSREGTISDAVRILLYFIHFRCGSI